MSAIADPLLPLRDFVVGMTKLVETTSAEPALLQGSKRLLAALLETDTWLPQAYALPNTELYQQYLLHCDPLERFSVVSFVWGVGQQTPIHDHTVWGLVGVLRGAELSRAYGRDDANRLVARSEVRLVPGQIEAVSPNIGDWHQVSNAWADRTSISIHVYGGNIGTIRRHAFDAISGEEREFKSGYSSMQLPNIWSRA